MKKPELLTTAGSLSEIEAVLKAGADAITIGHEAYALRLPGSFDLTDTKEAVQLTKSYQASLYVSMNALLHQHDLDNIEDYIDTLNSLGIDGIIFGDPAVFTIAKKVAPTINLHWNTETTTTNYRMINFWAQKGIKRAVLARELSLQNVLETKQQSKADIQAQIHGSTCIFHSKRELVTSYLTYTNQTHRPSKNNLFIQEQKRPEKYPIFEDYHGTHVLSSEDLCMIDYLPVLINGHVDSLFIDGLLKTIEYQESVVSVYRRAINDVMKNPSKDVDPGLINELQQLQRNQQPLGTGFYFKEQIY